MTRVITTSDLKPNYFSTGRVRLFDFIAIDGFSSTPKHLQLVKGFLKAIETGFLKTNDLVPSLNELKDEYEISRDTAEKCYKHLRQTGVLESVPGKGYYVKNTAFRHKWKVLLLFNILSPRKQMVYDSFVQVLGEYAFIDFYVYNNDLSLFRRFLSGKKELYTHYVIIPHFIENSEDVHQIVNSIPKDRLILLDKTIPGVVGDFGAVYENFEKDIYDALKQAREQLGKYHTIKVIFPANSYYPKEILHGAKKFCQDYAFNCKVIDDIAHEPIGEGEVFIVLREDDLVTLVERITLLNLVVGRQVGVISYNEMPLKKLILDGITTLSTDFNMMGRLAAKMILEKKKEKIELPFQLTLRPSL